ncbi:MAG TPA: NAD-dependent epimerase/dehydratase family protein [Bacteroidia bacterium]|jgi:UDP-glucose 4-epimerase
MILVLGAGFLGRAIREQLLQEGKQVRIFSREPTNDIPGLIAGNIFDLAKHEDLFRDVDTVIHTIHTTVPASAHHNEYYDLESNLLPFVKFLELAVKKKVPRVIYISTGGAIYGQMNGSGAFTERSPANPVSAYGISKLAIEKQLLLHKNDFRNGIIILRPSNIYGKKQRTDRPQGVVGHLLQAAYNNTPFELWGDGHTKKDYLYLDDFKDAIRRIIAYEKKPPEPVFNIASSHLYSVNEIRAEIERQTGKKINVHRVPEKEFDVSGFALDASLFSKTFGWKAAFDLQQGIADILAG